MAFQPINFASIAPQGNSFMRNLVDNLAQGYQAGQMPAQLARQRQQQELANALKQLQVNEEPSRFKTAMEGADLGNALKRLQLQEEPQRFQSALGSQNLQNQLQKMRMQQLGMELDPQKKLAYLNALSQGLNEQGGDDLKSAFIRHALGLPTQTPQEKIQQELDTYQKKMDIKKNSADGTKPTTAFTTANQQVIQAIDNTLPQLKALKEFHSPGQLLGKYLQPDAQAQYESMVSTITDSLVGALKLPKTNESIALVEKIVGKRPRESDKAYLKRLDTLENDLKERRKKSMGTLKGGKAENAGRLKFNPSTGGFE